LVLWWKSRGNPNRSLARIEGTFRALVQPTTAIRSASDSRSSTLEPVAAKRIYYRAMNHDLQDRGSDADLRPLNSQTPIRSSPSLAFAMLGRAQKLTPSHLLILLERGSSTSAHFNDLSEAEKIVGIPAERRCSFGRPHLPPGMAASCLDYLGHRA
jgi:hypothetical protein